jgi:hypothetical protein
MVKNRIKAIAYLDEGNCSMEELGILTAHDEEVRKQLLPVAVIASIPSDNIDAFLKELAGHVANFEIESESDSLRSKHRIAINGLITATARMIGAIEHVQKYKETETMELFFYCLSTDPDATSRGVLREWLPYLKRQLTLLQGQVKPFLTSELPKRGENRAKILLKHIWLTAWKFGGDLTYNKHANPGKRGTLEEVIEYFRMPRENLSPSSLDRLRPPRRLRILSR